MSWKKVATSFVCLTASTLYSVPVTDTTSLNTALSTGATTITFQNDILLSTQTFPANALVDLMPADLTITIDTNGPMHTLDGASLFRGFFIRGGALGANSIRIENIKFLNTIAKGGDGGSSAFGGGGGAGLGGAVYVNTGAIVTILNGVFDTSNASGGSGAGGGGGGGGCGGGGLHGDGGIASTAFAAGGNGGGGGFFGDGGDGGFGSFFVHGGGGGGGGFGFSGTGKGGDGGSASGGLGGAAGFGGGGGGGSDVMVTPAIPGGGGGGGGGATLPGAPGVITGGGSGGGGAPIGDPGGAGGAVVGDAGGGGGSGTGGAGTGLPAAGKVGGTGGFGLSGFGGGGGGASGGGAAVPGGAGGSGGFGGGGGGAGANLALNPPAGSGGDFGGGGGNSDGPAGGGGFAGGGGSSSGPGGMGGFGGGGGAGGLGTGSPGTSLFGGGTGDTLNGGGGAGFGGALFLQKGALLTLEGSVSFSGSSLTPGPGGGGMATAGSTGGTDIFMMSEGDLTFDITSNVLLPNAIEGDIGAGGGDETMGGLTKKGSALLSLTGDNTYTGKTLVMAGELSINSSVISEIEIVDGATLSGNFTAKKQGANPSSGNLKNSGRFVPGPTTPGDTSGLVNVEGMYTNESTGTLAIDITPTPDDSDKIILSGSATLNGGTLEVFIGEGSYFAGTQYTVIDGSVSGAFSGLPVKLGPLANFVQLDVSIGSLILTVTNNVIFQGKAIQPGTAQAVASCMSSAPIDPNSDFARVLTILGTLTNEQLNEALISISPVNYGAMEWLNSRNNSYVADLLSQHTFELCCSKRDCDCYSTSAWVNFYGMDGGNNRLLDDLSPFDTESFGGMIGLDHCFGSCFYIGGAFGYTHTDLEWRNNKREDKDSNRKDLGEGDVSTVYGALYGSTQFDCLQFDYSLIGGRSKHDIRRNIVFKGLKRTAKSHPCITFLTFHAGAQSKLYWGSCAALEPYGTFDYHYLKQGSFSEGNAQSISLDVKSKTQDMIRLEVGARGYWEYTSNSQACEGYCYAPYVGLGLVWDMPVRKSNQKASFKGSSCVMDVTSYCNGIHMLAPQVGVKWTHCCGVSFLFGYKGLLGDKTRTHQGEGRLEWVF